MRTGITLESLGFLRNGDELVRFLDGAKRKVGYGLRVVSGEIESLTTRAAELVYEELQGKRTGRIVDSVLSYSVTTRSLQVALYKRSLWGRRGA